MARLLRPRQAGSKDEPVLRRVAEPEADAVLELAAATPGRLSANQRERRAAILKVAIGFLAEREYEQVQMREIAEGAGVALATLYRYFPSKEQLFAHAFFAWGEPFGGQVRNRRSQADTDKARLQAAVRRSLKAFEQNPRFYRLITSLHVGTDRVARDLMTRFGERYQDVLAGEMTGVREDDALRVALIVVGTLDLLLRKWGTGDLSLRQVYREIDEIIELTFAQPRLRTARPAAAS